MIGHDPLARPWIFSSAILAGVVVQRAVGIENVDHRQRLPAADFVIVQVVGRRDLDAAAAQLGLGPLVGHQRNLAIQQAAASACGRPGPSRAVCTSPGSIAAARSASVVELRLRSRDVSFSPASASFWRAIRPSAARAPRPDRDARPRPCRPASFRAGWWRSSRAPARRAADRSPDSGNARNGRPRFRERLRRR